MTQAQNDALDNIATIIREHFESGIVIVEAEDEREMQWHGGLSAAIGACTVAIKRLIDRIGEPKERRDDE